MRWAEQKCQLGLIVSSRPHQRMLTTGFTAVISCPGDRESDSKGACFQCVSGNRYTWKGGGKKHYHDLKLDKPTTPFPSSSAPTM